MKALVERARDESLDTPDGWTVASVLGHMAFWDRSGVELPVSEINWRPLIRAPIRIEYPVLERPRAEEP